MSKAKDLINEVLAGGFTVGDGPAVDVSYYKGLLTIVKQTPKHSRYREVHHYHVDERTARTVQDILEKDPYDKDVFKLLDKKGRRWNPKVDSEIDPMDIKRTRHRIQNPPRQFP